MGLVERSSRIAGPLAVAVAAATVVLVAAEAPAAADPPQGPPAVSGGVDGQVYTTLVVGGTVYVGGSFTESQTQAGASVDRTNLAAFSLGSGALLGSWKADVNGTVRSLAAAGNYLYVGGAYTRIGGVAQSRLARVTLSTGAVDQGFDPQMNGGVRAVQVDKGAVFAGGAFTTSGGTSRSYLAKFDATTGVKVRAFDAVPNGAVNALALSPDGTRLAVGGAFTTLSGASRVGMGLVNPTSGDAIGHSFAHTVNPMLALVWSGDATALFGASGNSNNLAASWNPTSGARGWNFTVGGDVQAIDYFDGTVYVGFHDNYQGDTHTKLLAVDASSGAISSSFRPVFDDFWGVRSISAGSWGVVIGGEFTSLSGVWAHGWAQWPTATKPRITIDSPERSAYGKKVQVAVTVTNATGQVMLTGAGQDASQTLSNGSASFALSRRLAPGTYSLVLSYSGDYTHTAGTTDLALKVTKAGTKVRATVTHKVTTGRPGKVRVTVVSKVHGGQAASGIVRLKLVHGTKKRILRPRTLHDGVATFTLGRLSVGSWRLVAKYTGDTNHKAATHKGHLTVAKHR